MNKYILILVTFLHTSVLEVNAQAMDEGMVQYNNNFIFKEGVYLSFEEFKNNNPSIVDGFNREETTILLFNDSLNKFLPINPNRVWGYSFENNIYITTEDSFWKLINIGQLSQYTAVVLTPFQTVDAFGFPVERYSKTLSQLMIDFDTGEIRRLNKENLSEYLEETSILTSKLNKRLKNKTGLLLALKAYNELYPIYFPAP